VGVSDVAVAEDPHGSVPDVAPVAPPRRLAAVVARPAAIAFVEGYS